MPWWTRSKAILGAIGQIVVAGAALVSVAADVAQQVSSIAHTPTVLGALAIIANAVSQIGLRHKQQKTTPSAK